jgi:hypothetical protein
MGTAATTNEKVGRLIDYLVARDPDTVQTAVTALVLLGRPAVSEMIRRIDDRREMAVKVVSFKNTDPSAFEAVAQLGVSKVIDCLNLILSYIEHKNVGHIQPPEFDSENNDFERGVEAQRDAVAAGWRRDLAQSPRAPDAPRKSLPAPRSLSGRIGAPFRCGAAVFCHHG